MLTMMRANTSKALIATLFVVACSRDVGHREGVADTAAPTPITRLSDPPALAKGPYVGTRHNPLPPGVNYVEGATLHIDGAGYVLSHVQTPDGDMVWLDSIVTGARPPASIVRATVRVPNLARDERLLIASCDVNGQLDSRVVAIVVNEANATKFTKVRQAWRVDAQRGRFDVIPVAGITCEDPGSSR
jgi:hypothetical protein